MDNIFGDRFYGRREPGWHRKGEVFTDSPTPTEAVIRAGCNYPIYKFPLTAQVETPFGTQLIETAKIGLFRGPTVDDDNYRYLGIASPDYEFLQNIEVASLIEPIADLWPVETVGALGNGETIFITLDAGEAEVHGELIRQYFLVTDTRDGGTSLKVAFTPVRVVCQNTLISGMRQSVVSAAISHNPGIQSQLEMRVNLLQRMQVAMNETLATFERLAAAAITDDSAKAIFAAAYPEPKRPKKAELADYTDDIESLGELYDEATKAQSSFEYYCNRAQRFQDKSMQLYQKLNDEYPAIGGTAWAAWNAVVELADWREGKESADESAIFGSRAVEKRRAFAQAVKFAA